MTPTRTTAEPMSDLSRADLYQVNQTTGEETLFARRIDAARYFADNVAEDPENADWWDDRRAAFQAGEDVTVGGGAAPLWLLRPVTDAAAYEAGDDPRFPTRDEYED